MDLTIKHVLSKRSWAIWAQVILTLAPVFASCFGALQCVAAKPCCVDGNVSSRCITVDNLMKKRTTASVIA